MNIAKTIAVIGGDSRQIYAAQKLAEKGFNTSIYACEYGKVPVNVNICTSLENALECEIILLPLPFSKNGKTLNTPLSSHEISLKEVTDRINETHIVFYGMGSAGFDKVIKAKALYEFDYFTSENLIRKNAFLTAEGILGIILDKLPVMLKDTKVAITGYGRIGHYCADMLKKLGADVYAYTGNDKKTVEAYLNGITGRKTCELINDIGMFSCVINTAPSKIIDESIIMNSSAECVFIESASAPYGIDFDACAKHKRQVIKAFSLPGKTAPKSAGFIIAETIAEKLSEVNLIK